MATLVWQSPNSDGSAIVTATISRAGQGLTSSLSDPGMTSEFPTLAVNDAGDVAVAWAQWNGTNSTATGNAPAVSIKPTGGVFGPPQVLAGYRIRLDDAVQVALDALGNAAVAWTFSGGPLEMSTLPVGGTFGAAINVSGIGGAAEQQVFMPNPGVIALGWLVVASEPGWRVQSAKCSLAAGCASPTTLSNSYPQIIGIDFDFNSAGEAVASWGASAPGTFLVQAAVAASGAPWGTPADLGSMGMSGRETSATLDGQGNAFVTWTHTNTNSEQSDYGAQIVIGTPPAAPAAATGTSPSARAAQPVDFSLIAAASSSRIGRLNAGGSGTQTASSGNGTVAGVWAGPSTSGLTVHAAADLERLAPAFVSKNSLEAIVGRPFSFLVETTGFPAPSISSSVSMPCGLTFADNGDGTATLSGTPSAVGTYQATMTAANGVGPGASQQFTLQTVPASNSAVLISIAVSPASPSVSKDTTQQFAATGTYSDGSTAVLTSSVQWSSSNPATATVGCGGLATAKAAGTSTITASSGPTTGSTVLTVTRIPTQLVLGAPTRQPGLLSRVLPTRVTFRMDLRTAVDGQVVTGQVVTVSAPGGRSCTATTASDGSATCSINYGIAEGPPHRAPYSASFAGDTSYLPASATGVLP